MDYEQQKINFVNNSKTLKLAEEYFVEELDVFVEVVDSSNAEKVVSELVDLVKLSRPNNAFFSNVTVFKYGSRLKHFHLSYNKKVLFLDKHKKRITRDAAVFLISKHHRQ